MDLKQYDYTVIVDRSGSMNEPHRTGKSRWEAAAENAVSIARMAEKFDDDGITVYHFNQNFKRFDNQSADAVKNLFAEWQPGGSTGTAAVLRDVFSNYLTRVGDGQLWDGLGEQREGQKRGELVFLVTDGQPDDHNAVCHEIVEFSKKLNHDDQIALQFVQIGDDPGAADFLKFLDDSLEEHGAKFDIVDTTPESEIGDTPFSEWVQKTLAD